MKGIVNDEYMYTVTYLDTDGKTELDTETVYSGTVVEAPDLGEEREDYAKIWLDDNGEPFDFANGITEDMRLKLSYVPVGANRLYTEEVLSMIKTPAPVNFEPDDYYYQNYKYFAMMASVEITEKGRLWSCWIGGNDGAAAYLIATYSDDKGETWEDIQFVIDPHKDDLPFIMNVHIGNFWHDPLGRLWLFYQQSFQMFDGAGANFAIICENPDAENPVWSEPQYISVGASLKKPIVRENGEWILPVSVWERSHIDPTFSECYTELDALRGARVYASNDNGATWNYRGGMVFTNHRFNEHSVVELSDGRLMMYSRCTDAIRKSYSSDGGITWSAEEVAFPHVDSLAALTKLPSGNLLLVKHGTSFDSKTSSRSHLTAFVSKDDGATWEGGLILDERSGVSYPEIAVGSDGTIYVQYDRGRASVAEILFARFTESDVLAGEFISEISGTKLVIKNSDGIKGHPADFGTTAAYTGSGTESDPYTIANADQWRYFAAQVENGNTFKGEYIVLSADIDFGGKNIQPVGFYLASGNHIAAFSGNFDGNGYTLCNYTQNGQDMYTRALFGYVVGGTVANVTVKNVTVRGFTNSAAIVGYAVDGATISGCTIGENVSVMGYVCVGGVVGTAEQSTVKNCINNASILVPSNHRSSEVNVGGIAGYINNKVLIADCVNNGNICVRHSQNAYIGGIASNGKTCTIENCVNNGDIAAELVLGNLYVGGIAGWNSEVSVSYCANNGAINAEGVKLMNIGGVVGMFGKDSSKSNVISYCYNTADINVLGYDQTNNIHVGGVIGVANSITDAASGIQNSVNIGKVSVATDGATKVAAGSFIGCYRAKTMTFANNFTNADSAVGSGTVSACTVDAAQAQLLYTSLNGVIEK